MPLANKDLEKLYPLLNGIADHILTTGERLSEVNIKGLTTEITLEDEEFCFNKLKLWADEIFVLYINNSLWKSFRTRMADLTVADEIVIDLIEKMTNLRLSDLEKGEYIPPALSHSRGGKHKRLIVFTLIIGLLLIASYLIIRNHQFVKYSTLMQAETVEIPEVLLNTPATKKPQPTQIPVVDDHINVTVLAVSTKQPTDQPTLILREQCLGNWIHCSGEKVNLELENFVVEGYGSCRICLADNEYIVGTADQIGELVGLNTSETPFTAFIFIGPLDTEVDFYWAGGELHTGTVINVDELLEAKKDWIKITHISDYEVRGIQSLVITKTP